MTETVLPENVAVEPATDVSPPALPETVFVGRREGAISAVMPYEIEGIATETLPLSHPEVQAYLTPPAPPVPDITRRQLRLWLVRNGIALAAVEAAIDAMPEPARTEAQIEWQDASVYKLSNPLVIQIGAAVGLADIEMLKQAFRDAALI